MSAEEINSIDEFVDRYREVLGDLYAIKNMYDLWRDRKPLIDVYHIKKDIEPTWTGKHTFDSGITMQDVIELWVLLESNFPANPAQGSLLFDSNRALPGWYDGDNYGFPSFVDPADVETSQQAVSNTTDETEVTRFTMDSGALVEGRVFIMRVYGKYSTASSNDDFTYRVKIGSSGFDPTSEGTVIADVTTVQENVSDGPWQVKTTSTVFQEGASGTLASHSEGAFNNTKNDSHVDPITVDTTAAEDIVATLEWNNAKADNSATRGQAYLQQQA